jgi:hypothetical protein
MKWKAFSGCCALTCAWRRKDSGSTVRAWSSSDGVIACHLYCCARSPGQNTQLPKTSASICALPAAIPLELLSADLVGRMLAQALTAESGEVDLLIRAGGEKRLSDFLLWESAYAELLLLTGCGRILTTPIWMPRSKNSTVGNGALAVFRKPPRTPPCQGRAVSDDGHF